MEDSEIENLPSFQKLVKLRAKMVWSLTIALLLVLAGNIYLMSAGSELGSRQVVSTSPTTIVLVYSILVIILGAFCCIFYVWWANKYLDNVRETVKRDILNVKEASS